LKYQKRFIIGLICLFSHLSLVQAATDCNVVTEIPQIECEALVDLYNSTDGTNWERNGNWNVTNEPCGWYGVLCSGHVTNLYLSVNQLSGTIPDSLGSLSNLVSLELSHNQLSGPIPDSLGSLSNLESLELSNNQLSGPIPDSLGSLSNLERLWLNSNQLSGPIPDSLGSLSNLMLLYLHSNQLGGTIPDSLGNLSSLTSLILGHNQLSASIPESLGNLSSLTYLSLGRNQLSASIPESLGNLSNLTYLRLNNNQLSASIPESLGNLSSLQFLYLSNNQLCGDIPLSLMDLGNLRDLGLQDNHLTASNPELIEWLNNLDPNWENQTTGPEYCNDSPAACQLLYGVHDEGLNNSQFFTVSPETFEVKALGKMYKAHDIEALDIHPQTDELFAASGKDTDKPAHLYKVDKDSGELTDIGITGLKEIDGLSFHPDGTLWGWSTGDGLVTIDTTNGQANLEVPYPGEVEDLTWNTSGTVLFGVENLKNNPDAGIRLLAYDGNIVSTICGKLTQSLEIEALDILPDDTLILGLHGRNSLPLGVIDVNTCQIIAETEIATQYDDVEGIAWPNCQ